MLSALIYAMHEKKSAALVRYIGKGSNSKVHGFRLPDPKIGLLFPVIASPSAPAEYLYWCQVRFLSLRRVQASCAGGLTKFVRADAVR
jgi:hypothetical protein